MNERNAPSQPVAGAPDATEAQVLDIVEEVLGRDGIGPEDDLFDHGATSLSFVRVLAAVKQRLGVMVEAARLDSATAGCIAAHVAAAEHRTSTESMGA